jgi:hypothetical protein
MALRTVTVLDNNVTLTASAGNHTSSLWTKSQLNTDALLLVKITNGGTGPTVAAQAQVQVSPDNSNWYNYGGALSGTTTNSDVQSWAIPLSDSVNYAQVVSGSNTGQNVTIRCEVVG